MSRSTRWPTPSARDAPPRMRMTSPPTPSTGAAGSRLRLRRRGPAPRPRWPRWAERRRRAGRPSRPVAAPGCGGAVPAANGPQAGVSLSNGSTALRDAPCARLLPGGGSGLRGADGAGRGGRGRWLFPHQWGARGTAQIGGAAPLMPGGTTLRGNARESAGSGCCRMACGGCGRTIAATRCGTFCSSAARVRSASSPPRRCAWCPR